MSDFRGDTATMNTTGRKILNEAENFAMSKKKIDEVVERILRSDFTSDDAQAIANRIRSYDQMLREIHARLEAHGNFGVHAANSIEEANAHIKNQANKG